MATESFSRDIIVKNNKAVKLLRASLKEGSAKSTRPISKKGSKVVSDAQVREILRDF